MEWTVIFHEEFESWLDEQEGGLRVRITAGVGKLKKYGPILGRPDVESVKGSRIPNLKELRVQYKGDPWRVLFAFDPKRKAILLLGGNKRGEKQWYEKNIPIAERRYMNHLKDLVEKRDENP